MSIPSYTSRRQKLCTHANLMDLALSHTLHTYGKTLAKDALPKKEGGEREIAGIMFQFQFCHCTFNLKSTQRHFYRFNKLH